jgi:uncharacterized RDD family membrane protein YckC
MDTATVMNTHVVGKRIFAACIDILLWGIVLVIASTLFGEHTLGEGSANFNLTGIPAVLYFIAWMTYYIGMEYKMGGTLGKRFMKLKVVASAGGAITLRQSILRNAMRIIDGFPYIFPYGLGLIVVATNDQKQRLGDKIAHTVVVHS